MYLYFSDCENSFEMISTGQMRSSVRGCSSRSISKTASFLIFPRDLGRYGERNFLLLQKSNVDVSKKEKLFKKFELCHIE